MRRALVAGVGNVFFGDDAFGVEVARRFGGPLEGTRVLDIGIRAIHLAYELLDPLDLFVVADCMSRGGIPGTLYVVEPAEDPSDEPLGHGLNVPSVLAAVRRLGGTLPPTLVVGCEPATIEPGLGLSDAVTRAVPGAIELIRDLITRQESR